MSAELTWLSALLLGLAGSVHCVAMCGGIVGALTFAIPAGKSPTPYMLAYHGGRIASYATAGAITGGLGQMVSHRVADGLLWLNLLSGVFLILLGLYVGNWWRLLSSLEKAGSYLWKPISPLSKRFIPFRHPVYALPYGVIWGWLPCGLVYSTLTWSLASGSASQGALVMALFGLGTLPSLIIVGSFGQQLKSWLNHPRTRQVIAVLLCLSGLGVLIKALLH
ncbi:sulfite exporter TauE/SafE family protein [Aliiglaciecola sp. CAU 1673]|uniref:sulfite exporter TauE/SafE family protein n=1 Tax=Aliiglaciecola sp. CAU 1673 TaxID=3032595 RepID=UPI0023DCBC78|nr:sulfite exporter TauE/SafE family protein [Aliiglaciecola sp. CAU 1673]MDF2180160.1 sulfite exporter TauE/SafE family protein [Aliiglaciecola sp. CAU 1673]